MCASFKSVQVDAPVLHSSWTGVPDEVRVEDPTHPLYGRRFRVHSVEQENVGPRRRHALVWYENETLLRLPLQVLIPGARGTAEVTKLTSDSIAELVDRARTFGLLRSCNKIALMIVVLVGLRLASTAACAVDPSYRPATPSMVCELAQTGNQDSVDTPEVAYFVISRMYDRYGSPEGGTRARRAPNRESPRRGARHRDSSPNDRSSSALALPASRRAVGNDHGSDRGGAGGAR